MLESRSCQVLLVEPDQSVIDLFESMLGDWGVDVHRASTAAEALDLFSSTPIDIVITELALSGIGGLELLKRLCLVDHSVKIIVLSDDLDIDTELQAYSAGAYDYIHKPIRHELLLKKAAMRAYDFAKLQRHNQSLLLQLDTTNEQLSSAKSKLVSFNRKIKRLAATDSLTNLYNRRFIEQMLKQEADRRNRYQTALSIAFIDIDGFTEFSEEYGPEISNAALKNIAQILIKCARMSDIAARFAADVFLVLLPQTTPQNALVFANRAQKMVSDEYSRANPKQTINLTVSIGTCGVEATTGNITAKQLLVAASKALHTAKRSGPNNIATHPVTTLKDSSGEINNQPGDEPSRAA